MAGRETTVYNITRAAASQVSKQMVRSHVQPFCEPIERQPFYCASVDWATGTMQLKYPVPDPAAATMNWAGIR